MVISAGSSGSKQSEVKLGLDGDDVCPQDRPDWGVGGLSAGHSVQDGRKTRGDTVMH